MAIYFKSNPQLVSPATPISVVCRLLGERNGEPLLVVNEQQHLRGIITWSDVSDVLLADPKSPTAEDVMNAFVFHLPPSAPLGTAVALMAFEGLKELPIVEDGVVVGLIKANVKNC